MNCAETIQDRPGQPAYLLTLHKYTDIVIFVLGYFILIHPVLLMLFIDVTLIELRTTKKIINS